MSRKSKSKLIEHKSDTIKLDIVEKLINLYPQLKKDKSIIIDNVLNNKKQIENNYILEKIQISENTYYIDPHGFIVNPNLQIVGYYILPITDNDCIKCYLHNSTKINLSSNLQLIETIKQSMI